MPLDYSTLARVALPIFVMDSNDKPLDFCGTGFVMARDVFITCWHCVERPLPSNHRYVAMTMDASEKCHPVPLVNLKQDTNGSDLATATVRLQAPLQLQLGSKGTFTLSGDGELLIWPGPLEEIMDDGAESRVLGGVEGRSLRSRRGAAGCARP
jgi:hypothetical protein